MNKLLVALFLTSLMGGASIHAGSFGSNKGTKDYVSMTMASIRDGKLENVKRFVESQPAWATLTDDDGLTLTHKAAGHGKLDILMYLMSKDPKGMSLSARNKNGENALEMARKFNHAVAVKLIEEKLRELGKSSSSSSTTSQGKSTKDFLLMTMASIRDGKLDPVEKFVSAHPNDWYYLHDDDGLTLMHKAAGHGWMDIVLFLLDKDNVEATLRARNNLGETPLEMARRYGHEDIVKVLNQR